MNFCEKKLPITQKKPQGFKSWGFFSGKKKKLKTEYSVFALQRYSVLLLIINVFNSIKKRFKK
jgi:hypothetical protein